MEMSDGSKKPFAGRGRGLSFLNKAVTPSSETLTPSPTTSPSSTFRKLALGRGGSSAGAMSRAVPKEIVREEPGFYKTRPDFIEDKQGTAGTACLLTANYFKLVPDRNFELTLYRVEFTPQVDDVRMRKAFINKVAGNYS